MPKAEPVVAFREPDSIRVSQQFAVEIVGRLVSQSADQEQLPRCGLQEIGAAHDFRDSHGSVIDCYRELIRGNVIAPPNQKVAEIPPSQVAARSQMQVCKFDGLGIGNAKAPVRSGRVGGRKRSGIVACTARSWIERLVVVVVVVVAIVIWSARRLREIFTRATAWVNEPTLAQAAPRLSIVRPALALEVRAKSAATIGALAPANFQPAQIVDHGAGEFRTRALGVEIFIAQNQSAAIFDCPLRRYPEGPRVPEVQQARRRRGQASAITGWGGKRRIHKGILAGRLRARMVCSPQHGV